jgi:hypothetical protein
MQILQTLDGAGIEFDEGRLVQTVDIDLRMQVTLPTTVTKVTMPSILQGRNWMPKE